eukprot:jgi/Mesvir1/15221/Mv06451-RA.2
MLVPASVSLKRPADNLLNSLSVTSATGIPAEAVQALHVDFGPPSSIGSGGTGDVSTLAAQRGEDNGFLSGKAYGRHCEPFLCMSVGTNGQLLFPEHWREFRKWHDSRHKLLMSPSPPGSTLGKLQYSDWKPWLLRFIYAHRYFNIFASAGDDCSDPSFDMALINHPGGGSSSAMGGLRPPDLGSTRPADIADFSYASGSKGTVAATSGTNVTDSGTAIGDVSRSGQGPQEAPTSSQAGSEGTGEDRGEGRGCGKEGIFAGGLSGTPVRSLSRYDLCLQQVPAAPGVAKDRGTLSSVLNNTQAVPGLVILVLANRGQADFLQNWACSARSVGVTRFVVFAPGDPSFAAELHQLGYTVVTDGAFFPLPSEPRMAAPSATAGSNASFPDADPYTQAGNSYSGAEESATWEARPPRASRHLLGATKVRRAIRVRRPVPGTVGTAMRDRMAHPSRVMSRNQFFKALQRMVVVSQQGPAWTTASHNAPGLQNAPLPTKSCQQGIAPGNETDGQSKSGQALSTSSAAVDFGTVDYQTLIMMRSAMLMEVLALGYRVLLADIDAVWLRNPLPHMLARARDENLDVLAQDDSDGVCGGFMFLDGSRMAARVTWATVLWRHATIVRDARKKGCMGYFNVNEQFAFNVMLKTGETAVTPRVPLVGLGAQALLWAGIFPNKLKVNLGNGSITDPWGYSIDQSMVCEGKPCDVLHNVLIGLINQADVQYWDVVKARRKAGFPSRHMFGLQESPQFPRDGRFLDEPPPMEYLPKYALLNHNLFPDGHRFFDGLLPAGTEVMVVHNNMIVGKVNKLRRFREGPKPSKSAAAVPVQTGSHGASAASQDGTSNAVTTSSSNKSPGLWLIDDFDQSCLALVC